eukprot:2080552-Rhodomonas_salina.1
MDRPDVALPIRVERRGAVGMLRTHLSFWSSIACVLTWLIAPGFRPARAVRSTSISSSSSWPSRA